ncbi:MAG: DUF1015 domain-containing protein [Clostridiales bacterium]|nr:DUF1015 domain-containing protein [Clostridiales bacterium]
MKNTGLKSVNILLPNTTDMQAWACIACDQFTSEPEYWKSLEDQVKGKKTTLDLVLPEIYLDKDVDERIERVNANIKKYILNGDFNELAKGFVLVVRSTPYVKRRIGLVAGIDLECYDYAVGKKPLIRATEGTIEERIPPRLKIRKNADIEFPHVMVLFDDEKREILETLYERRSEFDKVYDFELNMGGGHVEGYFIPENEELINKFSALLDSQRLIDKYGKEDDFAFAVGDGNHSLATAKTMWNSIKETLSDEERETHPARIALCELVNIYDEGIYFEPIFRFVKGVDKKAFIDGLTEIDGGKIVVLDGEKSLTLSGKNSLPDGIRSVDAYIKDYLSKNGGSVDYIHGEANLKKLVDGTDNSVGIIFEKLNKSDLFKYVSEKGAFPRKTFSMGEGVEKRYYLEGRRITK